MSGQVEQTYRYNDEAQTFRQRYLQKVEALLKARFPTLPEMQAAIREGRLRKEYPMSLSDWLERVMIDDVVVAEMGTDSYFVITESEGVIVSE
jgi:hypothetical protein